MPIDYDLDYFLDQWDTLMYEYYDEIPTEFLQANGFQNVDEMVDVLENALEGINQNGLDRIRNIRNYLMNVRQYFNENYPYNYKYDEDAFDSHEEKLEILKFLIEALEPRNFAELIEVITPEEIMSVRSLRRQKNIPEDMEREITSFIGNKPRGGRKSVKKTRKSKKSKKSKKKRKTRKTHRVYRKNKR